MDFVRATMVFLNWQCVKECVRLVVFSSSSHLCFDVSFAHTRKVSNVGERFLAGSSNHDSPCRARSCPTLTFAEWLPPGKPHIAPEDFWRAEVGIGCRRVFLVRSNEVRNGQGLALCIVFCVSLSMLSGHCVLSVLPIWQFWRLAFPSQVFQVLS